jgi:hypothetical protein
MSTITVPLPEEDLKFLRSYASAQGISAEALVARQARTLREQLQRPLPRAVMEATAIVAPDAGRQEHLAHLGKKHA